MRKLKKYSRIYSGKNQTDENFLEKVFRGIASARFYSFIVSSRKQSDNMHSLSITQRLHRRKNTYNVLERW